MNCSWLNLILVLRPLCTKTSEFDTYSTLLVWYYMSTLLYLMYQYLKSIFGKLLRNGLTKALLCYKPNNLFQRYFAFKGAK